MITQAQFVKTILANHPSRPTQDMACAYAPSNIALCKYWGKRDEILNLPETSSLSISLADRGTTTLLKLIDQPHDEIRLGRNTVPADSVFSKRLITFLNLFRPAKQSFLVETNSNIPIAAGLASSASGFAALVSALDLLFDWHLDSKSLSMLARLGSGSAARSFWQGFVEWHRGDQADGLDSYAEHLPQKWPELKVGLLISHGSKKAVSSREAMQLSKASSPFYKVWPSQVAHDLGLIKSAIESKDFDLLGSTAEQNAMAMHAIMISAKPAVLYWQPETVAAMHRVWQLRAGGVAVYFTQDAGPNLKLLFLEADTESVLQQFPSLDVVSPFIARL